jgi:hypothetical protein
MFKKLAAVFVMAAAAIHLSAYNPPAGGENLFSISSPGQLTSASSSAGGAVFNVTPASQVYNPALQAYEQRIMLDAGFTALYSSDDPEHSFGSAFQTGILIPTKWGVGSAEMIGSFIPFEEMQTGKSFNIKSSFAKDITDKLAVGAGLGCGYFFGYDTDWSAGVDLGVLYKWGTLGALEDVRFGASLLNLGKTYTSTTVIGINDSKDAGAFPGIATIRTGMAATFMKTSSLTGAFSADVSIPTFQNFIFDTGLQFVYRDFLTLSTSWECNAREIINGSPNLLPSLGVTFRFMFNSANSSFMKDKGWQESEMAVSTAWQHMYDHINAVSGGATLKLGLKDTEAPKISLWNDMGDEK